MNPTLDVLYFIRLIVFPLCSLGFIVSAIYEYQNGRSKLRLAIMLTVAVALLVWMVTAIATGYYPEVVSYVRGYAVTPVIILLTALIWSYAILRVHICTRKYNTLGKGGCSNGEVQ
jgi:fatty acid desaturase